MPSVRYYNQSAPFWDFVASLEEQGSNHPFFAQHRREGEQADEASPSWGWGPWGRHRGFPFRGPHHAGPEEGASSPPPTTNAEGDANPAPQEGDTPEPPHPQPGHGCHRGPPRGCHGRRVRGFGGRGGWHGRGPFGMGGMPWAYGLAPFLSGFMNGENNENGDGNGQENAEADFAPDADVFDTEASFVVHVSLPGAKKEDVGVNWDAEKSELSIAGVVYRPGDEDFLKTLAMDERKVGPFERKIRLGSRANPAQVDADMITAKLEDGVLRIDIPKLDRDYVEVKKVDVE